MYRFFRAWHIILACALSLLYSNILQARDGNWLIAAENFPPYSYMEGEKINGIAMDYVRELLVQAHIKHEAQLLPWARVVEYLDTRPNTLTPAMAKTEDREAKYVWFGPFDSLKSFAWTQAETDLSKIFIHRRHIGIIRGSATEKHLLNVVKVPEANLYRVNRLEQMVGLLVKGRVDVIYVAQNMEDRLLSMTGKLPNSLLKKGELLFELPLYVAANKLSDESQLAALDKAAQQMLMANLK